LLSWVWPGRKAAWNRTATRHRTGAWTAKHVRIPFEVSFEECIYRSPWPLPRLWPATPRVHQVSARLLRRHGRAHLRRPMRASFLFSLSPPTDGVSDRQIQRRRRRRDRRRLPLLPARPLRLERSFDAESLQRRVPPRSLLATLRPRSRLRLRALSRRISRMAVPGSPRHAQGLL